MADDINREEFDFGEGEPTPPEESSNRTFLIVAGILGGITVLALVLIALYAFVILPGSRQQREAEIARLTQENAIIAEGLTQTADAAAATATFTPTKPAPTNTPGAAGSPTPVVVVPTNTLSATQDPATATVSALLTQAALVTAVPTATALPTTGFVEDVGLPGLLGLTIVLLVVILLARRLRTA